MLSIVGNFSKIYKNVIKSLHLTLQVNSSIENMLVTVKLRLLDEIGEWHSSGDDVGGDLMSRVELSRVEKTRGE